MVDNEWYNHEIHNVYDIQTELKLDNRVSILATSINRTFDADM